MNKNKYLIPGIIVAVVILVGIFALTKNHKKSAEPVAAGTAVLTDEQKTKFQADIDKQMQTVNDKNSTKATVEAAWMQIGIDYESLGQRDKEEQAFLKASETDPNSYIPLSSLATLYVETKTYDKAAENFQKALGLPGGSADPQLWVKWINFNIYQIGSDDKHIRLIFNDAYKYTGNNEILLRQGAAYLEMVGDYQGAIAAWQEVLKQFPNDAAVKAAITADQAKLKK